MGLGYQKYSFTGRTTRRAYFHCAACHARMSKCGGTALAAKLKSHFLRCEPFLLTNPKRWPALARKTVE